MKVSSGYADINGGRLYFEEAGNGPPLVLLHGFACDTRLWQPQFETLTSRFRTIRYDLRGFGRSSLPAAPYDHVDDLRGLLAFLDIGTPALAGLSLGANIALGYAVKHPQALCALMLLSSGLPGYNWTTPRPPDTVRAHARQNGVEAGKAFWMAHDFLSSSQNSRVAKHLLTEMTADYSGWHWQNSDLQEPSLLAELLDRVTAPTLVVSGDLDNTGYREIAQVIADGIPGARLETFPDAGHMLNLEKGDAVTRLMAEFADEHCGRASAIASGLQTFVEENRR